MYLLCKFYQHLGTRAIAHRLHIAICRQLPACPQRPGWDLQPLPAEVKFTHRVLRGFLANQQYMKPGQEPYCMAWWYMIMICDDCIGYGSRIPTEKHRINFNIMGIFLNIPNMFAVSTWMSRCFVHVQLVQWRSSRPQSQNPLVLCKPPLGHASEGWV